MNLPEPGAACPDFVAMGKIQNTGELRIYMARFLFHKTGEAIKKQPEPELRRLWPLVFQKVSDHLGSTDPFAAVDFYIYHNSLDHRQELVNSVVEIAEVNMRDVTKDQLASIHSVIDYWMFYLHLCMRNLAQITFDRQHLPSKAAAAFRAA